MRNVCLLLTMLSLLSLFAVPCQAGNKELMQKWAAKKQYVRDQILEELRKQGDLPENGTIQFEARVKTGSDGKMTTFTIDSVQVFDARSAAPAKAADGAGERTTAGAKGGAGMIREETIDFAQTAPGASGAGASGKLKGQTRMLQIHGRLTEGVLDIPGTAVISDAIVLEDGRPSGPRQDPEDVSEPGVRAPAESSGDAEKGHEVGDEKTEKSWWKIW